MLNQHRITRRSFLRRAAAVSWAAPLVLHSRGFAANDRTVMAGIGMGGQGRGDLGAFLGFKNVQVVAVCDVVAEHRILAKAMVDHINHPTRILLGLADFGHRSP